MDLPTMSLKVAPFQFATFNPTQYTSQAPDPTLLYKSMITQEGREKEAKNTLDIIDTSLAQARNVLNIKEHGWLNELANNIRAGIDKQLELGNWQSAIRFGQEAARDLKRNVELQDKIKVNEIYNIERNKIQNGNYSKYTKRRWDDLNQYSFDGTADWKANFDPVTDMSISDIWNLAVNRARVMSKSSTSSNTYNTTTFTDNKGNLITKPTETYTDEQGNTNTKIAEGVTGSYSNLTTTSGGGSSETKKTREDIINIFNDLLKDSNIIASLRQEFDNMTWLYGKAKSILNNPFATETEINQAKADLDVAESSLSNKDGFLYVGDDASFKAWYEAQAEQYAKDSEYIHTSTSSQNSNITSYSDSSIGAVNGNNKAIAENLYSPQIATTTGPFITYKDFVSSHNYDANNTMQWITTLNNINTNNGNK